MRFEAYIYFYASWPPERNRFLPTQTSFGLIDCFLWRYVRKHATKKQKNEDFLFVVYSCFDKNTKNKQLNAWYKKIKSEKKYLTIPRAWLIPIYELLLFYDLITYLIDLQVSHHGGWFSKYYIHTSLSLSWDLFRKVVMELYMCLLKTVTAFSKSGWNFRS